jgi:hypothetical protein
MPNGDAYATLRDPGRQLLAGRACAAERATAPDDAQARAALDEYRAWSAAGRPGAVPQAEARRLLLGEPG